MDRHHQGERDAGAAAPGADPSCPISFDVRYDLTGDATGAELSARVAVRRGGGLTGRLVANATAALLSAGALDGAAGRIARVAESQQPALLAA